MNGNYSGDHEKKHSAGSIQKRSSQGQNSSGIPHKKVKIDNGQKPAKHPGDSDDKVIKQVLNYDSIFDGKSAASSAPPKSALNSPSALNSMIPPKKVKKEPVSPVKAHRPDAVKKAVNPDKVHKQAVKQEDASPIKSHKPAVKQESVSPVKSHKPVVKQEVATKKEVKKKVEDDDDNDDIPLLQRKKKKSSSSKDKDEKKTVKKPKTEAEGSDDEPLSSRIEKAQKSKKHSSDKKPAVKEEKHGSSKKRKLDDEVNDFKKKATKESKDKKKTTDSPAKGKKKPKEEEEVWKWWEEKPHPEGIKWVTLEHNGPYFPPAYEKLPSDVKFYYDGKNMRLSDETEEVAGFYARMIEHEYTTKDIFNKNFMEDWRKVMTDDERKVIKDLKKCNFREIFEYYQKKSEERKSMSKEEKQKLKEENQKIADKFGNCIMDGHKQKVGNYRVEPPGLFRGRGDHPKQGKLKTRLQPEDITINIGKDSPVPPPPVGHKWKAVQHDNKVTWLACWVENIAGNYKYVMLNSATKLKGEKDWQKYETARKLKDCVDKIRANYQDDWKSKEMRIRQRSVALYFIDKLALRAGHEKEEGETADTVGCCSLRVEHIKLHKELEDQENVVEFDFLGKDSIRYQNRVPVEKRVFKNLALFMDGKSGEDELFDRLTTTSLNKHLGELMEGLTAKVFRTFNASKTLQDQLSELTVEDENATGKLLSYNRANRAVAILCNHQRAAPKTFDKQMENLMNKIKDKKSAIKDLRKEVKEMKSELKGKKDEKTAKALERKENQMKRLKEQLFKLEVSMTDKEENKEIALGTSKLNYLDPRISVAWCKKNDVPIEKIYNKTQRQKFQWAIDMTDEDFVF